jgi:hypothetical protein
VRHLQAWLHICVHVKEPGRPCVEFSYLPGIDTWAVTTAGSNPEMILSINVPNDVRAAVADCLANAGRAGKC